MTAPALLAAETITKRFPGVVALRNVSFDLQPGEIHAICGENGAGKSTLIKLLSGIYPHGSYEGELRIDGETARFRSIADAERAGIAVIYQELALVEQMSVAENIFLGVEPHRFGFIDWHRIHRDAQALLDQFAVRIDPTVPCARLGVGQKQLVEIVKALGKKSRILILDEPTAALAEHEVQTLLGIVRDLRGRGISCIYISHKLDEVFAIADRITVLRDGESIGTTAASATSKQEIIRQMVGRDMKYLFPPREGDRSPVVTQIEGTRSPSSATSTAEKRPSELLRVNALTVADPETNVPFLRNISFHVDAGEVLGIGGLMGAGRTELLMHLFGAWGVRLAGTIALNGRVLPPASPAEIIQAGMALVSEDRRRYGLFLDKPIGFNLSLAALRNFVRGGFIDSSREIRENQRVFQSLNIKAQGLDAPVAKLSGGNQQKVVLGKTLITTPRVVLLDEPTRGIDVGAKLEIYEIINALTRAGKGVVLVSSELPELIGMSDRIVMLHDGHVGGSFRRAEATPELLMRAAMA